MEFKLVIADPKTGKCIQKAIADEGAKGLIGKKIGEKVKGEAFDLTGYEFEISGGSDNCGFPMRKGISGARKRILTGKGVGFRGGRKGMKRRKTVCGETINSSIVQINLKITKQGAKKLETEKEGEAEGKEEANPEEAKKEGESPAEEKKEAHEKKEETPKQETKPKEAKKEEESSEKKE
ncbi:30S ribosomal protein S6e [Candidatus Woesearchaeota archaeon]|nr:30S ribosomal protein S6e [Candidatus Woesearchaeota archaeon]